ncbi:hypothetical protein [Crocosphaera chwakensis]|uniref:Uncharacterized protein n=1 Tax=Crocosphaera chwakensis CCY0110 TaxID=391612 RepID=A3IU49_9CHRO|nr:hypothetical protein [Crocosphaera chwakensis]EAZ90023.1 hypothetical protein CY0110_20810 [Crocosphaera chwakensis CCY0110]
MTKSTILSSICTKSLTQVLPSCSISILVLSGYFYIVFGGLMIGFGSAIFYQALRSSQEQKSQEIFVATSTHIHSR